MCKRTHFVAALALCTGFGLCSTVMAVAPKSGAYAAAKKNVRQVGGNASRAFSQGPGGPVTPSPRGGGETIHSGIPACDDQGVCDSQVGVTGAFTQECPLGSNEWVSLAFPVATNGAVISSVIMTHTTNDFGGHLFLLDDCGGNPDVGEVLYEGCDAIVAGTTGQVVYDLGGAIQTNTTTWVVAVFNSSFSFDVAYNSSIPGTGLGYGNLDGSSASGSWTDLADVDFGFCYCVELGVCEAASDCCEGAQCDGDANGDGLVDPLDSGYAAARFGGDVNLPGNCQADVNCDGTIDPLDTGYILARFGTCNPPILCAPGGGECGAGGSCEPDNNAPVNDDCANALVAVEGANPFDSTFATTDGPVDCDEFTGNFDVWYRYTSPSAGTLQVSTCSDIGFDGTMSIYSGSTCVGTNLGCSDDGCNVPGGGSELVLSVTAGQVVTIRLGGWDDGLCGTPSRGAGTLTIDHIPTGEGACCFVDESCTTDTSSSCTGAGGEFQGANTACTPGLCIEPANNDNCEGANVLPVTVDSTATASGTTVGATADCLGLPEVWEGFSTAEVLDVRVDYCGTPGGGLDLDFVSGVIADGCPGGGACGAFIFAEPFAIDLIQCPDGSAGGALYYPGLAAGTYYYPLADEASGGPADYTVNFTATLPTRECCEVHTLPGCDTLLGVPNEDVDDCVCSFDEVCCTTTWDEACVAGVELFGCGSCTVGCETPPFNNLCECVSEFPTIDDNTSVQYVGDTTGATIDCDNFLDPEVWLGFTLPATDRIYLEFCDQDQLPFSVFINLYSQCTCAGTVFGPSTIVNHTCPDGTVLPSLRWTNVPAGSWYYPLLSGPDGIDGPYDVTIGRFP